MDYSLIGYLKRQSTEKLVIARKTYMEQEQNSYNRYIIDIISEILDAREDYQWDHEKREKSHGN